MGVLPGIEEGVCISCGSPMLQKNDLCMCMACKDKTNRKAKAMMDTKNDGQRKRFTIKLPMLAGIRR